MPTTHIGTAGSPLGAVRLICCPAQCPAGDTSVMFRGTGRMRGLEMALQGAGCCAMADAAAWKMTQKAGNGL